MEFSKTEEKSPLLLYIMENEGNVSRNNKKVNFDKGRLYGISSGATTVFTEFPNYVSPCWLTAILSGLIFFMLLLLTISSITPSRNSRLPRCIGNHFENIDNKTIHLIHDAANWDVETLHLLETIKNEYSTYHVHIVELNQDIDTLTSIITSSTTEYHTKETTVTTVTPTSTIVRRNKRSTSVKSLLDILLNSRLNSGLNNRRNVTRLETTNTSEITTLSIDSTTEMTKAELTFETVAENFPNLTVEQVTVDEVFSNTPLEKHWVRFNPALRVFSLRVLRLWQYGGLSFKFNDIGGIGNAADKFSIAPRTGLTVTPLINNKLMNFIKSGKLVFEKLPDEVITADDEGYHMFTKMPCHAFFGEVLLALKKANGDESAKTIIRQSLKFFCERSSMSRKYCKNVIRKWG
ncbi:hypothetical protein GWI33_010596 [Rhynchophorus ferrugineus]|uniref:Uncharacterized protein n=1 Tax=Rhynchophorus ferrugineus TaxID=354439 RepID=A0A834IUW1_RHYFE|nr:hypothetical protein GWI33_010596 [Rhynchophorus ferrugineus]